MSRNMIISLSAVLAVALRPASAAVISVPADQPELQATVDAAGAQSIRADCEAGQPNHVENFDTYLLGSQMHGQGGWVGWDLDPAAGALVSDVQSRSAPHAVDIVGASDLLYEYSGVTSGRWTLTAWQFIPATFAGKSYFILHNTYILGGPNKGSMQIHFDSVTGVVTSDFDGSSLPLRLDEWVELRVEIDLYADVQSLFYGGDKLYTKSWSEGLRDGGALSVAAMDFFANGASSVLYDDISLVPRDDCNANGVADACDIVEATSDDANVNGLPDECESDCNANGIWDVSDILAGTSNDCNWNIVPDECDLIAGTSQDLDDSGALDECEIHVPAEQSTIQAGIDAALDRQMVIVAPGTYLETIKFLGKAITVRSSGGAEDTVIDANSNGRVVTCFSYEGPDTVLEGFTIRGGLADYGGGMYIGGSDPTVSHCIFSDNRALSLGGGICSYLSDPTVTSCTFRNNTSGSAGGGMYNEWARATVTDCVFTGNFAKYYGGGMYNEYADATATRCKFTANSTDSRGGGMYNFLSGPTVSDCAFSDNSAYRGGGMYNKASEPAVTSCTFSGNSASHEGGGMYNHEGSGPAVTNSTFSGNSAGYRGGGFYNFHLGDSHPTLSNCTFTGNSASSQGGGIYTSGVHGGPGDITVTNSILWGNMPDEVLNGGEHPLFISHCDIQGGIPAGTTNGGGNAASNPTFVDADGPDDIPGTEDDNLRLQAGSPCINSGDNSAIPSGVTTDLDGNARIHDGTVDMGAYEFGGGCPKAGSGGVCPQCDLNESGVTEGLDIAIITSSANFGLTVDAAAEPCADVNQSGVVEGLDVAVCTSSACFGL